MNKAFGIALLVAGFILMIYGINATDSLGSSVSKFFTGTPTDKSMWLLIGGVAAVVTGLVMTARKSVKL